MFSRFEKSPKKVCQAFKSHTLLRKETFFSLSQLFPTPEKVQKSSRYIFSKRQLNLMKKKLPFFNIKKLFRKHDLISN